MLPPYHVYSTTRCPPSLPLRLLAGVIDGEWSASSENGHDVFRGSNIIELRSYSIRVGCWLVLIGSLFPEINSSLVVYADYVIFVFSNWPVLVVDTNEYQGILRQKGNRISATTMFVKQDVVCSLATILWLVRHHNSYPCNKPLCFSQPTQGQ